MPFLAFLFSSGGIITILGIACAALLAMWDYRGDQITARDTKIAMREAEIVSVAEDANRNAAAAARIRADWQRADAIVAQRDRELANAKTRLEAARRSARAVPAGSCAAPQSLVALSRGLRGVPADTADRPPNPDRARDAPRPVVKPRVPG